MAAAAATAAEAADEIPPGDEDELGIMLPPPLPEVVEVETE